MRSPLAQAIRDARLNVRLTQVDLGERLGLTGRAVYRWERAASAPRKHHQRALVAAIRALDPEAAKTLQSALDSHGAKSGAVVVAAPAAPPAPAPPTGAVALELAVFAMAEELDVGPRRVRAALAKLLARAAAAGFSLDSMRQHVDASLAAAQDSHGERGAR